MYPLKTIYVTSPFGWRTHPILEVLRYHTGVDLRARTPMKTFAIDAGCITEINHDTTHAYGKYIMILHANGYSSFYAHLSRIDACVGDKVKRGQAIGLTGNTGKYSTAAHLHFGVTKGSTVGTSDWVNPLEYLERLKEEEYMQETIITLQKKDGSCHDLNGQIYKGITLAPVRAIGEALGCRVDYDPVTKYVTIIEEEVK